MNHGGKMLTAGNPYPPTSIRPETLSKPHLLLPNQHYYTDYHKSYAAMHRGVHPTRPSLHQVVPTLHEIKDYPVAVPPTLPEIKDYPPSILLSLLPFMRLMASCCCFSESSSIGLSKSLIISPTDPNIVDPFMT